MITCILRLATCALRLTSSPCETLFLPDVSLVVITGLLPESEAVLRQAIASQGLGGVLSRVEAALTHRSDWPARVGAAPDDVAAWWTHVVTLHRKSRTLNRELKDAEQALGTEPTEENLMWLRDVQERLAAIEGTEALIEGFGASSGRAVRSL